MKNTTDSTHLTSKTLSDDQLACVAAGGIFMPNPHASAKGMSGDKGTGTSLIAIIAIAA